MKGGEAQRLVLEQGDTSLTLAPEIGGGVAAFRWREHDLFRRATPVTLETRDPLGLGAFPLVPFAGRIAEGRFTFLDQVVCLSPNLPGEASAIHGQGWRRAWSIAGSTATKARLTLDHPAGEWPWNYRAEQTYVLEDGALTHRLAVTNASMRPMPTGLGIHPYFPRELDTCLEAEVMGVFMTPDTPPLPPPPAWDWRGGRAITAFVDHQFHGWSGSARVNWPSRRLTLTLTTQPKTPYLVVYAPTERDFVCVEPVSHQLDGVNRSPGGARHGMTVLAPGASVSLTTRFEVSRLEP
jgi:aldose 1-epimerase